MDLIFAKKPENNLSHFVLFFTISVLLVSNVFSRDCLMKDQCSCQFDDDSSLITIASIGNSDSTPRFKDVPSPDGNAYSFNPCLPFNEGDQCQDSAACAIVSGQALSIGAAFPVQWQLDTDSGNVKATYSSPGTGLTTTTEVFVVCDPQQCDPILSADGISGVNNYKLTLTTVCGCPNGCTDAGPVNCSTTVSGFSGGSVFLIVLFSLLFVYVIGGMVYMKLVRKATGMEVVPNVELWKEIPFLVKDGFGFVFGKCFRRGGYTKH